MPHAGGWSLRSSPESTRSKRTSYRRRRRTQVTLWALGITFLLGLWLGTRAPQRFGRLTSTTAVVEREVATHHRSPRRVERTGDASLCGVLPAPCSGHGTCRLQRDLPTPFPALDGSEDSVSGLPPNTVAFCECDAGWAPPACDRPLCPGGGHCSGNGACVDGACVCEGAWRGAACDRLAATMTPTPGCPRDNQTGLICGGPQRGACQTNGTCACRSGWSGPLCEQTVLASVYELAQVGVGTLVPCQTSPSPRATPFVVAVLPPAEQGRRWLGFQVRLIPLEHSSKLGTRLPWLCIAYDLAERLGGNAMIGASDIVVTRWVEERISDKRSWLLTAAVSVPESQSIVATLQQYLEQVLPIKVGLPIHVANILIGHDVSLDVTNDTNTEQLLLTGPMNQPATSSVSVLEALGIAAMGLVVFIVVLAAFLVADAWWQRRQSRLKGASSPTETSPRAAALVDSSRGVSPSAPTSSAATSSTPLGMNLEELVTISLSPERPWRYRSWRRR